VCHVGHIYGRVECGVGQKKNRTVPDVTTNTVGLQIVIAGDENRQAVENRFARDFAIASSASRK